MYSLHPFVYVSTIFVDIMRQAADTHFSSNQTVIALKKKKDFSLVFQPLHVRFQLRSSVHQNTASHGRYFAQVCPFYPAILMQK